MGDNIDRREKRLTEVFHDAGNPEIPVPRMHDISHFEVMRPRKGFTEKHILLSGKALRRSLHKSIIRKQFEKGRIDGNDARFYI